MFLVLRLEKLAVLRHLATPEQRPPTVLERRFGDIGIVLLPLAVVVLDRLAAPGERARELPARRNFASV